MVITESTNVLILNGKHLCYGKYDELQKLADKINTYQNEVNIDFTEIQIKPVVIRKSIQVLKGMVRK